MTKKRWIVLGLILLAVLCPVLYVVGSGHSAAADIAAIRLAGFPTTYAELDAAQPQDGQNAAPVYADVVAQMSDGKLKVAFETVENSTFSTNHSNGMTSPKVRQASAELAGLVAQTVKGSQMPRCVFAPGKSINGIRNESSRAIGSLKAAELLENDAKVQLANGNESQAFNELEALARMTSQESRDLGFMPYMDTTLCGLMAVTGLIDYVKAHPGDRAAVEEMLHIEQMEGPPPSLMNVVRGVFPGQLAEFEYFSNHPSKYVVFERGIAKQPGPLLTNSLVFRTGVNQFIHAWRIAADAMPKDSSDIDGVVKALAKGDAELNHKWPARALFSGGPFETYMKSTTPYKEELAQRRMVRISALLLLYRFDHATLPASIPLSGRDAVDPWTGKAFVYQRTGNGFKISSAMAHGRPGPMTLEFK